MTENLYTPDCIRTVSGQYVNVFNPDPETILIEDIAHSLSMQCRFGAHLPEFYSVAQHSYSCSLITLGCKLEALMHDASEAYLLDIPKPIKQRLLNYKEIEDGLMKVIADKFGFTYPLSDDTKQVDEIMLRHEWRNAMLNSEVVCYDFKTAKNKFLNRFYELT